MASAGWKREGCPVGKKPLQAPAFCRSVPKTCPQGLARQRARRRLSSFPATFSAPGRGHHAEPLRLREVLRGASQYADLQAVCGSSGEPTTQSGRHGRYSAVLSQTTKIPDFRGFSFSKSPLTDSNRRPPPYHFGNAATGRNRRQRFSPVFAASVPSRFATDCHRLQPRGSIKAPSLVVYVDNGAVAGRCESAEAGGRLPRPTALRGGPCVRSGGHWRSRHVLSSNGTLTHLKTPIRGSHGSPRW
jgi:hypothetical protein